MLDFKSFVNENYTEYKIGDHVLIRYWLTGDIVPVKIINKKGNNYFIISHKVGYSPVFNGGEYGIKKSQILGMSKDQEDPFDPTRKVTDNPRLRPDTSGVIPGNEPFSNDISI